MLFLFVLCFSGWHLTRGEGREKNLSEWSKRKARETPIWPHKQFCRCLLTVLFAYPKIYENPCFGNDENKLKWEIDYEYWRLERKLQTRTTWKTSVKFQSLLCQEWRTRFQFSTVALSISAWQQRNFLSTSLKGEDKKKSLFVQWLHWREKKKRKMPKLFIYFHSCWLCSYLYNSIKQKSRGKEMKYSSAMKHGFDEE